jgi:hypothetical protein
MAAKKKSSGLAGGVLIFLGSLIYLYIIFSSYQTWYGGGSLGAWLGAAQFLGPFVAAFAVISAITLFFMSFGVASGKMPDMMKTVWKVIMLAGVTSLIVAAGGVLFYVSVAAFVLAFLGAMLASM